MQRAYWSLCTSRNIITVRVVIIESKQRLSLSDLVNGREIFFRHPFKSHTFDSMRLEWVSEIQAPYIDDFPENLGKITVQEYKKSTSGQRTLLKSYQLRNCCKGDGHEIVKKA